MTVSARRYGDLAWASVWGYACLHTGRLSGHLEGFDLIFNTVPAPLFDASLLRQLREDCFLLDLASAPGGVDFAAAQELGVKVIWALALPGKAAPVTAGRIVRDAIYHILTEEGI